MATGCHSCEYCWKLGTRCRGSQWLCEKHDLLIIGNGTRCKNYKGKRYDRREAKIAGSRLIAE